MMLIDTLVVQTPVTIDDHDCLMITLITTWTAAFAFWTINRQRCKAIVENIQCRHPHLIASRSARFQKRQTFSLIDFLTCEWWWKMDGPYLPFLNCWIVNETSKQIDVAQPRGAADAEFCVRTSTEIKCPSMRIVVCLHFCTHEQPGNAKTTHAVVYH